MMGSQSLALLRFELGSFSLDSCVLPTEQKWLPPCAEKFGYTHSDSKTSVLLQATRGRDLFHFSTFQDLHPPFVTSRGKRMNENIEHCCLPLPIFTFATESGHERPNYDTEWIGIILPMLWQLVNDKVD